MTDLDVSQEIQELKDLHQAIGSKISQMEDACNRGQHYFLVTTADQAYTMLSTMRAKMKHLFGFGE